MPIPQLSRKPKSSQGWRSNNRPKKRPVSYSTVENSQSKHSRSAYGRSPMRSGRHKSRRYHRKGRLSGRELANLIFLLLIGILSFVIVGMIYIAILSRNLPDPNKLMDRSIAESTKIYDRTGENILYEVHGNEKRTIIKLDEVPEYIKWATITAEDRTFYEHHGFNLLAMFKGVIIDPLTGKRARGGSTLTQQLVKNAILTNERKISRKIKEFIISYRIENKFSKDEILQMYLNEIPYGSTAYGIEAAARKYFGESAKDINLAQAVILTSLPKAPTFYSPYGNNKEGLIARQQYVLKEMEKLGYITENEMDQALNFELEFQEPTDNITAPHFVFYVRELLSEKYGDKIIEQEGLKIYTTLDLYKQEIAEEVIEERGEKNEANYNAKNASLVSIDPKTGQILAMVGSRDYFNDKNDGQVNVALSLRQPGSSLKPLVYSAFFKKGYTPNTILYDVITNFAVREGESYEPHNYDSTEHGPVTVRKALAGSLNIPAVKALYLTGVKNVTDLAQDFGYQSLDDPDRYGLSLVLGGGEVRLLDHTSAFGVFAREGEYYPPVAILKVEDRKGKVLEEYEEPRPRKVLSSEIARKINNILSDNEARAYAFGANNWLTLGGRPIATKTGTTNDYRDAWTIGYTPSLVTGVWVGNNDNEEMKRGAAGGVVAAPIWNQYMQRVLGNTPSENFNTPEEEKTGKAILDGEVSGVTLKIDKASGLLANENTPPELIEEKTFNQPHSILYYVNKDDPRGQEPGEKNQDEQFQIWENAIKKWAEENKIELDEIPTESDNIHRPELIPQTSIDSINVDGKNLQVTISASAPNGVNRVEYYVNDHLIETRNNFALNLNTDISFLANGDYKLTAKVCDPVDNCWQGNENFTLSMDDSLRNSSLSLSLSAPTNNSVVQHDSFPLELKIISFNPQQIKNVNFYYIKERDTIPKLITTNSNINKNEVSSFWSESPAPGTYFIYAEAIGTDNSKRITQKAKVIVR